MVKFQDYHGQILPLTSRIADKISCSIHFATWGSRDTSASAFTGRPPFLGASGPARFQAWPRPEPETSRDGGSNRANCSFLSPESAHFFHQTLHTTDQA